MQGIRKVYCILKVPVVKWLLSVRAVSVYELPRVKGFMIDPVIRFSCPIDNIDYSYFVMCQLSVEFKTLDFVALSMWGQFWYLGKLYSLPF